MASQEGSALSRFFAALSSKLIAWQVERPFHVLLLALLLTVPAVFLAKGLELRTGFDSLLPDNKPSVKELKRVGARTAGVSTFIVVADISARADGTHKKTLQQFGDGLLPRLRALGPDWVGTAENGVQAEQEFLRKRQSLFLSFDKIKEIHDKVEDRYDFEVHGSLTGDEPEPVTRESIEKELGAKDPSKQTGPPYPDGYYMNAEGTRLVTLIRTAVSVGQLKKTEELIAKVQGAIGAANPASFDPTIKIEFTGDVVVGAEQYGVVKNDLATVGAAGILMILFVDWLFFLRLRAVLAMGVAIGIGVLWTFAVTRLVIGHLNTASGFLVSIVFGNGINYGILLRARFNEARREGLDIGQAVTVAYRDTWRPTLTVAAAAGVGYVSLATTDFRGFRDFGAIGGYGMLLCWIANYLFMVPLLVVFERFMPTHVHREGPQTRWQKIEAFIDRGLPFGAPFARLARVAPMFVAVLGIGSGVAAGYLTYKYIKADPLEYKLSRLENDPGAPSKASQLGEQVTALTGRTGQDGMAIMTDRIDQVQPLVAELQKRWDAAAADQKPFSKVVSIFNLLPDQQGEKIKLLLDTRKKIERIHELGKINDKDWEDLEKFLPPKDITPFGIAELPERVARPFTERDGTRGRVVFIAPTEGRSVRDVRYLRMWADAYRETKLPSGEVIVGSGRAVIFADMIEGVMEESPKAIVLSFLGVAIVVLIAFWKGREGGRASFLVVSALVLGIVWMGVSFRFFDLRINFLNFIAVPITFGIGVDYAINVVNRWRLDGPGSVIHTVRETGGAVVLCSLTTTLGYLALLKSINAAVRSFGLAAVIGELTCIFAALVVLPAVLILIDRREGVPVQR
jgi:predicted RND superfamily exporter protein